MKHLTLFAIFIVISLSAANAAMAQTCKATPQRYAQELHGFITGKRQFTQVVGNRWVFTLEPAPFGWDIRLRDKERVDLSQITPPFRGAPNPRQIYGWHFRNAANTAKNQGDVNAPQHLRQFQFSPALTGTGGFRPSNGAIEPDPDEGRGWLRIYDIGLSDLEPDQKARMNYLKFKSCLTWPRTQEETRVELDLISPIYLDEEREIMFGCGLNPQKYVLTAWNLPRMLGGDFDGDDALDHVAPVIRRSDGRKGLAICRAGTWMSIYGYGGGMEVPLETKDGEPRNETYFSLAQYFDRMEYWKMGQSEKGKDRLILGRTEKAEVAVKWDGQKFVHELLWVFVEP